MNILQSLEENFRVMFQYKSIFPDFLSTEEKLNPSEKIKQHFLISSEPANLEVFLGTISLY